MEKTSVEMILRFTIFLCAIIVTIVTVSELAPLYLIIILLLMLNTQVRVTLLKNKSFVASVLLDTCLIAFLSFKYQGFNYILYYIPIITALFFLKEEGRYIALLNGLFVFYTLRAPRLEAVVLNIALMIVIYVLLWQHRGLTEKITDIEYLYDENRRYSYDIEIAKLRLEEYAQRVEQLTQLKERERISIEIHDTIGHRLTALLMQMEAASQLMEIDIAEGRRLLSSSTGQLRESIDILRATVKNIRPKEFNGIITLQEIIHECRAATGLNITYDIHGMPFKLVPICEITLCKNLQESITNSIRHGEPQNIKVSLSYTDREIILSVKDDGRSAGRIIKGMGLTAMEERAALLGGSVDYNTDGGFETISYIPVI